MIIYFSGTGNSRYVAEALAERLQDELVCSNTFIKKDETGAFSSERPWVFVYPIYVSTMAGLFRSFIEKAGFSGCKDAYFVATCASDMGVSVNVGREVCKLKGLEFKGAEKVVMPQNYIALFNMTPPDEIKKRQENALRKADRIANTVREGGCLRMKGKSSAEYAMTRWIEKLYDRYFTGTKKFLVTDKCVSCSLCVKVCPLNNIRFLEGKPAWGKDCVHCMSCINRCPHQAIEYGKKTVGKERYVCKRIG